MGDRTIDKTFDKVLATAQANGDNHDYRHLEGWRDIRKVEAVRMYVQGKVSLEQAIIHGAKPKDHLAALKAGVVTVDALLAVGISLQSLQRAETRQIRSLMRQTEKLRAEIKANTPKVVAVIAGRPVMAGENEKPKTAQELQVMIALMEHENRMLAKKQAEAKAKRGFEVQLSAEEQAKILAAHADKGIVIK